MSGHKERGVSLTENKASFSATGPEGSGGLDCRGSSQNSRLGLKKKRHVKRSNVFFYSHKINILVIFIQLKFGGGF